MLPFDLFEHCVDRLPIGQVADVHSDEQIGVRFAKLLGQLLQTLLTARNERDSANTSSKLPSERVTDAGRSTSYESN